MGTLTLVRHGQASFGAADYDQLSELGHRQSELLGEYFKRRGHRFDAVMTGSLKRHAQTRDGIARGLGGLPESQVFEGLNEYDSEAVVRAVHPGELPRPDSPDIIRQHFRLLREGLLAWMAGSVQPAGMPPFTEFQAGIVAALTHAQQLPGDVLLVSSGGPISTAMGWVLGLAPEAIVALNLRIRNSAVSELIVTPRQFNLLSFNHLPHLDTPELASSITYA